MQRLLHGYCMDRDVSFEIKILFASMLVRGSAKKLRQVSH